MALVRKYSSVPTPLYNIQPNDLLGQNYEAPTNVTFCMASEESFYRPSLNEVEQTEFLYPRMPELVTGTCYEGLPTLQPYNAGPYLQTQPSFSTVFSPISGSLASPQGALNPSPASLRKEVQKANPKEKGKRTTRNATQSAKQELLIGKPKRKRGPNKQRSDTSFSYLFDNLSQGVRNALEKEYEGCCDSLNAKDLSTIQKHRFTKRHCLNLPKEYREAVPNFVCPAFLLPYSKCRSKAGRYDSAERHCQNCAGFQEINWGKKEPLPVVITRSEYDNVRKARLTISEKRGDAKTIKLNGKYLRKLLERSIKDGLPENIQINPDEDESNCSDAIVDHAAHPTPQPPSTFEGVSAFPVTDQEAGSSCSGTIMVMDYATQPTRQPPTTSAEPVFGAGSFNGLDFDHLPWQMIDESIDLSGAIALDPVTEQEIVERDLDNALRAISEPDVSPTVMTAGTSEPGPEIHQFDSYTSHVYKSDLPRYSFDLPLDHTPYSRPQHTYSYSPPFTATMEPVLESVNVGLGLDNGFSF